MAETEKDKKVWINMEILTKEQCKVNAPAAGESEGRAYPWQAYYEATWPWNRADGSRVTVPDRNPMTGEYRRRKDGSQRWRAGNLYAIRLPEGIAARGRTKSGTAIDVNLSRAKIEVPETALAPDGRRFMRNNPYAMSILLDADHDVLVALGVPAEMADGGIARFVTVEPRELRRAVDEAERRRRKGRQAWAREHEGPTGGTSLA